MKPKVFIGSSSEPRSLEVARALQVLLSSFSDATVWDQGVSKLSKPILDSLLGFLDKAAYGAFVFSEDDIVKIRGQGSRAVRDNVIFELGLYMGRLGPHLTAIVKAESPQARPEKQKLRIPTDLLNLEYATFDPSLDDLVSALGPASTRIREALKSAGLLSPPAQPPEVLARLRQLCDWVWNHREGKLIRDWKFELHFHDPAQAAAGKLALPGFSVYEVRKCRYNLILPEKPFRIGLTIGEIAASAAWQDNPAYLHQIYTAALKDSERQALTRLLTAKLADDPLAAWETFFEGDRVSVSEVGKSKSYPLTREGVECGDRYVFASYHLPAKARHLVGREVTLDLSFKTLRPNSFHEFTLEFP